ncbi:hypothetical protein SK128_018558 [Halocaridina rubra]|uniref:Uncharacterized protein n=1 Tax=Halocaridina rubra TaxID=373956 RepID=A0AAN8XG38_HALRR
MKVASVLALGKETFGCADVSIDIWCFEKTTPCLEEKHGLFLQASYSGGVAASCMT